MSTISFSWHFNSNSVSLITFYRKQRLDDYTFQLVNWFLPRTLYLAKDNPRGNEFPCGLRIVIFMKTRNNSHRRLLRRNNLKAA